jgi:pimeloyl-ACP methyl ester carboxylesterase
MTRNGKGVHRDGYVQLPSLRLHYIDYGGSGETIIALHGLIQNARAFDAIVPALVPHVRLIALDLRGRGGSDWSPSESYRWVDYLNDLRGFFQALQLPRFALLGSSMGGTLGMLYAMAHPKQVTGLVMNDTSLNTNREGVVRASLRVADAPTEFTDFDSAVDWFAGRRPWLARLGEETLKEWVGHYLTRARDGKCRLNCDPAIIRRARLIPPELGPREPWSHRREVWEQVKRLTMPMLILRGEFSEVVPRESAELMAEILQDASWAEVPGCGHAPTLYEPEAHAALRKFFGVNGT